VYPAVGQDNRGPMGAGASTVTRPVHSSSGDVQSVREIRPSTREWYATNISREARLVLVVLETPTHIRIVAEPHECDSDVVGSDSKPADHVGGEL